MCKYVVIVKLHFNILFLSWAKSHTYLNNGSCVCGRVGNTFLSKQAATLRVPLRWCISTSLCWWSPVLHCWMARVHPRVKLLLHTVVCLPCCCHHVFFVQPPLLWSVAGSRFSAAEHWEDARMLGVVLAQDSCSSISEMFLNSLKMIIMLKFYHMLVCLAEVWA